MRDVNDQAAKGYGEKELCVGMCMMSMIRQLRHMELSSHRLGCK